MNDFNHSLQMKLQDAEMLKRPVTPNEGLTMWDKHFRTAQPNMSPEKLSHLNEIQAVDAAFAKWQLENRRPKPQLNLAPMPLEIPPPDYPIHNFEHQSRRSSVDYRSSHGAQINAPFGQNSSAIGRSAMSSSFGSGRDIPRENFWQNAEPSAAINIPRNAASLQQAMSSARNPHELEYRQMRRRDSYDDSGYSAGYSTNPGSPESKSVSNESLEDYIQFAQVLSQNREKRSDAWELDFEAFDSAPSSRRNSLADNCPDVWQNDSVNAPNIYLSNSFSTKIFLGGIPWDIQDETIMKTLDKYGVVEIIRPNKDDGSKSPKNGKPDRHGFIYVVLRSEEHVRSLLCDARKSKNKNGAQKFSINLTSRRLRSKDVEVKAWPLSNSTWQQHGSPWENTLNPKKTIFVGALHGEINAEMLQRIMADKYGAVESVVIDTDKNKYPIGSGRVSFQTHESYQKAVLAEYLLVKTRSFEKKLQLDPYIETKQRCQTMLPGGCTNSATIFCRHRQCFNVFCEPCWQFIHRKPSFKDHRCVRKPAKTVQ